MTSYLQTVTIEFPTSPRTFFGLEQSPICPPSLKAEDNSPFIILKTPQNAVIIWWNTGMICKTESDETMRTWYPKISKAEAIKACTSPKTKGAYFEYHSDGSQTAFLNGNNYYWSAPIKGTPEVGTQVLGYDYDENEYDDAEIESMECNLCKDTAF